MKDILGLEKEGINGKSLLIKVVNKGRIVYKSPALNKIRLLVKQNLARFPERLKDVYPRYKYPVIISPQLERLRRNLTHQLEKRQ